MIKSKSMINRMDFNKTWKKQNYELVVYIAILCSIISFAIYNSYFETFKLERFSIHPNNRRMNHLRRCKRLSCLCDEKCR